MWLAQAGDRADEAMAALLVYGVVILIVFLVQVAILRWIIRVNVIVKNQEETIELLRRLVQQQAGPRSG